MLAVDSFTTPRELVSGAGHSVRYPRICFPAISTLGWADADTLPCRFTRIVVATAHRRRTRDGIVSLSTSPLQRLNRSSAAYHGALHRLAVRLCSAETVALPHGLSIRRRTKMKRHRGPSLTKSGAGVIIVLGFVPSCCGLGTRTVSALYQRRGSPHIADSHIAGGI